MVAGSSGAGKEEAGESYVSPSNLALEIMQHLFHHNLFVKAATKAGSVQGDGKETPFIDGKAARFWRSLRIGNTVAATWGSTIYQNEQEAILILIKYYL